ncbi:MAG: ABC transporter ATP-binding protein [Patescibacteria group bacterium]
MIRVQEVIRTYGEGESEFKALKGVSFALKEGENLAILGKSGSGKSTLMHALAGLDRPSSGRIIIKDKDLWSRSQKDIDLYRSQDVGFVFQDFYLQNEETVLENVMVPLEINGDTDRKEKAMEALKVLEIDDKANNKANQLSGGQKQRVCIARAIVGKPSIIFADEPTGNLDSKTSERVEDILFNIHKKFNTTLIVVTHDKELSDKFSNSITLKDGEITSHTGEGIQI